jgi:SAM-dependent methyltransferase
MRSRSIRIATLALLLAGLIAVAAWVRFAGGADLLEAVRRLNPGTLVLLVGITFTCVLLRFLRWQYLLRRVGVRIPTRRSLSVYLASLAGIATPAYLGETLRCALIRREFGAPLRRTIPVWVVERLLDFGAIGMLAGAAASGSLLVFAGVVAGIALLVVAGEVVPAHAGSNATRGLGRAMWLFPVFGLSLAAWLPAMFVIWLAASGLGTEVGVLDGVRIFGTSTLGGGFSLMPAGMVAMGSLAIVQLERAGLSVADAVAAVSVVRLATAGITLAIGGAFLVAELRSVRRRARAEPHFDAIAGEYLDQFAPHIWDLLLERKTELISGVLGDPSRFSGVGVDLGCGLGRQSRALRQRGYRVIGLDPAHGLLRHARAEGTPAAAGSALALPFADESVDFVVTVGVLHHLGGSNAQAAACREVARVLRPGGVFIVHETNPRNPIFRLYMSYVFPVLRSIDEGVEHWIESERWSAERSFRLETIRYFTFLPDFLPRGLLRLVLPLERRLERSGLNRFSVHYMAVMRKSPVPVLAL